MISGIGGSSSIRWWRVELAKGEYMGRRRSSSCAKYGHEFKIHSAEEGSVCVFCHLRKPQTTLEDVA